MTLLIVAGCETVGLIEYKNPATGESWRAQNPSQAAQPVTLTRSARGDVAASASAPRREDTAVKQMWFVPLIGAGLVVLGVATLTLRGWFALVPISASLASMACGAVLIAAPKIVQEAWWIIAVIIGAVVILYAISWFDNRVKLKTPAPQPQT